MSQRPDEATTVSERERFDEAKVFAELVDKAGLDPDAKMTVLQFPSGHSNLTYLLSFERPGAPPFEWVLRRPPIGNAVSRAHDMAREYSVLSAVHPYFSKAPEPILLSTDEGILGAPFFVMKKKGGLILRKEAAGLTEADFGALGEAFAQCLGELHLLPVGSTELEKLGKPEGYVERQVQGWAARFEKTEITDAEAMRAVSDWLHKNLPPSADGRLIHNDLKFDNLVLNPESPSDIWGVLDWEMSTVGDPLMDLGTALAYWVEATDPDPLKLFALGPTYLPGNLTRAELVRAYREFVPFEVPDDLRFYLAFAMYKNAVVAAQIYARWKRGQTRDPRFGVLIHAVTLLAERAKTVIDTGVI